MKVPVVDSKNWGGLVIGYGSGINRSGSADRLANMHVFAATALNLLLKNLSR